MSSELVKELRSGDLLSTRHEAADRIEALEARNIEHEMRIEAEEAKSAHWKQRADRAEAQLAEAREALEPFADIAGEPWADESGWTDAACQNDRICDWFGPSAFLAARRALTGGGDD